MKKFQVVVSKLEYTTVEVEAENIDEAYAKVEHWDESDFAGENWQLAENIPFEIEHVEEMEPDPVYMFAKVGLRLKMNPDEEMEEAADRLYDLLYDKLVRNQGEDDLIEFEIYDTEIREE